MGINPKRLIELHSSMTSDAELLRLLTDIVGPDLDLAATATAAVTGRKEQVLKDLKAIDDALEVYCGECGSGLWSPGRYGPFFPEPEMTDAILDPFHRTRQFWDDLLDRWHTLQNTFIHCVDDAVMSEI